MSVTQSFNTTSSMGRLTLNVLLSFAQFEREVTGERIRDKIAASKKKGMWMGGTVPLGYEVRDRKLVIVQEQAEQVRLIFKRYLNLGSLDLLMKDLRSRGIQTRVRRLATGHAVGGIHSPAARWPTCFATGSTSEKSLTGAASTQASTRRSWIVPSSKPSRRSLRLSGAGPEPAPSARQPSSSASCSTTEAIA